MFGAMLNGWGQCLLEKGGYEKVQTTADRSEKFIEIGVGGNREGVLDDSASVWPSQETDRWKVAGV